MSVHECNLGDFLAGDWGLDFSDNSDYCSNCSNSGYTIGATLGINSGSLGSIDQSGTTSAGGNASGSGLAVMGIAGPPFVNQLPEALSEELSNMAAQGVTALSPADPGFAAMAEQAGGQINWTLLTDGQLLTSPALDGITHAATAGGADVMGAGTAQVASGAGETWIFDVTAQSGQYLNGATAAQSEGVIDAGVAAFETLFDTVFRDIIPPMYIPPNLLNPHAGDACPPGGC